MAGAGLFIVLLYIWAAWVGCAAHQSLIGPFAVSRVCHWALCSKPTCWNMILHTVTSLHSLTAPLPLQDKFFQQTLPFIIDSAAAVPRHLQQQPLPLLLNSSPDANLEVDANDCVRLLAAAFLCTYPLRTTSIDRPYCREYTALPSINMDSLLRSAFKPQSKPAHAKVVKTRMVLRYFDEMRQRVAAEDPSLRRKIVVQRRPAPSAEDLGKSRSALGDATVLSWKESQVHDSDKLRYAPTQSIPYNWIAKLKHGTGGV